MAPTFDPSEVRYYIEDNADKILIAIGITSLTIGLLFLSILISMISILGFFFGMIFTFVGILMRIGTIVDNVSRAEKIGAILIVISVVFFAGSFSCFLVREIARVLLVPLLSHGVFLGYELRIAEFNYPFLWLIKPLFLAGLGSLIAGIILKNR